MACKLDPDLLQDYLDGAIEPLEKLVLDEHLKVCRECRKMLTELKLLFWELEDLDQLEIPPEVSLIHEKVEKTLGQKVESENFNMGDLLNIQKNILDAQGKFIAYIPGLKTSVSYLRKSAVKASSRLYRNCSSLVKARVKMAVIRTRS